MNIKEWWMPDAQQQTFRAVLDGFARPGTQVTIGSEDADALLMLLATLLDESATLADAAGRLTADQRRLLLASDAPAARAQFVVLEGGKAPAPDFEPALGTLESPESGATLLITVSELPQIPQTDSTSLRLQGPGVAGERLLHVAGLHPDWLIRRAAWVASFPLGVDIVLCTPKAGTVLPRTTRIELQRN